MASNAVVLKATIFREFWLDWWLLHILGPLALVLSCLAGLCHGCIMCLCRWICLICTTFWHFSEGT